MRLVIPKRPAVKVEDAFSTTLYTGNGTTQDITTGIDLVNHDGLVWIKNRSASTFHLLMDTERGANFFLNSTTTSAQGEDTDALTDFTETGFSIGADAKVSTNADNYVSWNLRKARRFFDVAEVTKASGSDATVSFPTLGTLGMVVVKRTDSAGDWYVWHRSLTAGKLLYFTTAAEATLGHITVSGTTVTLEDGVIADGDYIVYAWAHDTATRGIVQCGSYTGNGSETGPEIDLGWRPQWLLVKRSIGGTAEWFLVDSERDPVNPNTLTLSPSIPDAEYDGSIGFNLLSDGFQPATSVAQVNGSGDTFVYLAIREE